MTQERIGRFEVKRKLGGGPLGGVYLCLDAELKRRVVIKRLTRTAQDDQEADATFRREARTLSLIQHPSIVAVYEAGEDAGVPYLVFEYAEGKPLSKLIQEGKLGIAESLDIFQSILEGIDRAHRQGIAHGDLKPGNIVIGADSSPKIMDFGVNRVLSQGVNGSSQRVATPRYMAPEYLEQGQAGVEADVYALGLILAEMLTSVPVFKGETEEEVLASMLQEQIRPPSALNKKVDERLNQIVLKALERDPAARYPTAGDMLARLKTYRAANLDQILTAQDVSGTITFLQRRMQRNSDFPALSQSISTLNRLVQSEEKDVSNLASVIVKDYALTNKILKVVNSAHYSRFAGKINTISRAIVVLGVHSIRSIASSLILFEHMQNKVQARFLQEQVYASLFSAVLARQVALDMQSEHVEENFLCAMFHNLGSLLVTYYLDDERTEIQRLIEQEGMPSLKAQYVVLGGSYEQIGMEVARQWNFPRSMINSIQRLEEESLKRPRTVDQEYQVIACFANQASEIIGAREAPKVEDVEELLERYRMSLGIGRIKFTQMVAQAVDDYAELTKDLSGNSHGGAFARRLTRYIETRKADLEMNAEDPAALMQSVQLPVDSGDSFAITATDEDDALEADAVSLLTEGLQEVTNMLMENYSLGQVFTVVLESMYRSRVFLRVLLCLQDIRHKHYLAKMGFGKDIEAFTDRFRIPVDYQPDVFHLAMKDGVDIYIADARDKKIQSKIPGWYQKISDAGSFLIFPMSVNNRTIGFIYADHADVHGLDMDRRQLNLLKAMRNQAVLAFQGKA